MFLIEDCVNELLKKQSCVVVPGFGGFVAKRIPARIDFKTGTLYPAKKEILFNPNLLEDDGLLKHAVVKASNKDYQYAENLLLEKIADWKSRLDQEECIEIKELGQLLKHGEQRYVFIQDEYSNHLLDSYGLSEIRFEPVLTINEEEKAPNNTSSSKALVAFRALGKYAAVLLVAFIAFYSYWIPVHTNVLKSGMINWSDLNPFVSQPNATYTHNKIDSNNTFQNQNGLEIEKPIEKALLNTTDTSNDNEVDLPPTTIESKEESLPNQNTTDYALRVVVGCFGEEKNISRFLQKLSSDGFSAFREKHGRLTRICILATNNQEEANQAVEKSRMFGYKGWILK